MLAFTTLICTSKSDYAADSFSEKKVFVRLYMYESYIFISRVIDTNFSSFTRSEDNCSSIILSSVVCCFVIQLLRSFKEILAVLPFPANTCLSHSVFLHFNVSSKTCLSSCSLLSDSFSVWHSVLISSNSRWATASSSQCLLMDCTCRSSNLCASFNDCINFFTTKQGKKKKKLLCEVENEQWLVVLYYRSTAYAKIAYERWFIDRRSAGKCATFPDSA